MVGRLLLRSVSPTFSFGTQCLTRVCPRFISDCMGHPPLIPDNSFTTRLPANVDEDQFTPSSTTLPAAPGEEESEKGTAYFVLKCR